MHGGSRANRVPSRQHEFSNVERGHRLLTWCVAHNFSHPAVLVNLLAVNRELLGRMVEGAWRSQASPKQIAVWDALKR